VTLDEICTRRVAVWGIGHEGVAMVRLLGQRAVVPTLIDDQPVAAAARLGPEHHGGVVYPDQIDWADIDVVVRAPGVSRYRAELSEATAAGVSVTTAMAVWLEDFADAPVVAITGTKGKSTTAALTASILRAEGRDVALIGNIGVPVTDMYGRQRADAYVVEVSSYQAADVAVSPGVCILTSLAPDHLDWHRGEDAYYRDKLRLIEAGPPGAIAVNAASDEAVSRTDGHPHRILFGPAGRVRAADDGTVTIDDRIVAHASDMAVPGRHNVWNLCGALAGALLLEKRAPTVDAIATGVAAFGGLPSRCHTIGQKDGLTFVDDALASNPFATEASLGAFPDRPLTLVLGGADRGVDPTGLLGAIVDRRPELRVVVLAPDTQGWFEMLTTRAAGSGSAMVIERAPDIEQAVKVAVAATLPGGVVLFSPAAPTEAGEGGYAERSRRFAAAVGLGPEAV
jgi:UDP-N-acetylmuramoylalanine--D-glutamate ligase